MMEAQINFLNLIITLCTDTIKKSHKLLNDVEHGKKPAQVIKADVEKVFNKVQQNLIIFEGYLEQIMNQIPQESTPKKNTSIKDSSVATTNLNNNLENNAARNCNNCNEDGNDSDEVIDVKVNLKELVNIDFGTTDFDQICEDVANLIKKERSSPVRTTENRISSEANEEEEEEETEELTLSQKYRRVESELERIFQGCSDDEEETSAVTSRLNRQYLMDWLEEEEQQANAGNTVQNSQHESEHNYSRRIEAPETVQIMSEVDGEATTNIESMCDPEVKKLAQQKDKNQAERILIELNASERCDSDSENDADDEVEDDNSKINRTRKKNSVNEEKRKEAIVRLTRLDLEKIRDFHQVSKKLPSEHDFSSSTSVSDVGTDDSNSKSSFETTKSSASSFSSSSEECTDREKRRNSKTANQRSRFKRKKLNASFSSSSSFEESRNGRRRISIGSSSSSCSEECMAPKKRRHSKTEKQKSIYKRTELIDSSSEECKNDKRPRNSETANQCRNAENQRNTKIKLKQYRNYMRRISIASLSSSEQLRNGKKGRNPKTGNPQSVYNRIESIEPISLSSSEEECKNGEKQRDSNTEKQRFKKIESVAYSPPPSSEEPRNIKWLGKSKVPIRPTRVIASPSSSSSAKDFEIVGKRKVSGRRKQESRFKRIKLMTSDSSSSLCDSRKKGSRFKRIKLMSSDSSSSLCDSRKKGSRFKRIKLMTSDSSSSLCDSAVNESAVKAKDELVNLVSDSGSTTEADENLITNTENYTQKEGLLKNKETTNTTYEGLLSRKLWTSTEDESSCDLNREQKTKPITISSRNYNGSEMDIIIISDDEDDNNDITVLPDAMRRNPTPVLELEKADRRATEFLEKEKKKKVIQWKSKRI